jgi:hypothetical protein
MPRHKRTSKGGGNDFLSKIGEVAALSSHASSSLMQEVTSCTVNKKESSMSNISNLISMGKQLSTFGMVGIYINIVIYILGLYVFPVAIFILALVYFIDVYVNFSRLKTAKFYAETLAYQELIKAKKLGSVYVSDYILTIFSFIILSIICFSWCFYLFRKMPTDCGIKNNFRKNAIINAAFLLVFFIIFIIELTVFNMKSGGQYRDILYSEINKYVNLDYAKSIQSAEDVYPKLVIYINEQISAYNNPTNPITLEELQARAKSAAITYAIFKKIQDNDYKVDSYNTFFDNYDNLIKSINIQNNQLIDADVFKIDILQKPQLNDKMKMRDECIKIGNQINGIINEMKNKTSDVTISKLVIGPILLVISIAWLIMLYYPLIKYLYQLHRQYNSISPLI